MIVDRHTGAPVAGATVQVYVQTGSGLVAGGYGTVGNTHAADAKGRFFFSLALARDAQYVLLAHAPPAYHTIWGEAPTIGKRRQNQGVRVPMQAPAYVRIRLQDDGLPNTQVAITVYGYASNVDEFRPPFAAAYIRALDAGEKRRINWQVKDEAGAVSTGGQDLFVSPLDTQDIVIHF